MAESGGLENRYTRKRIEGSNPSLSAICRLASLVRGDVAQLGERLVRNEEVVGSIPIISTSPFARFAGIRWGQASHDSRL